MSNSNSNSSSDSEDVEYEPEQFQVGPFSIQLTTIAYMPIEKLAKNQSKGVEISGQKLWCGSVVVIEYLLHHTSFVQDTIVFELGAGTGCLGMISKLIGASKVFLTDHDNKSIQHMKQDLAANHIVGCEVSYLNWYDEMNSSTMERFGSIDRSTPIRIVAGDVLYKASLLTPFFKTVKALFLYFENCEMLLCHVPRAENEHEHVIAKAKENGFTIIEIHVDEWRKGVCCELSPAEDYMRAKLYSIQLIHS